MDFASIYHFLFETYGGLGTLVAAGLVISVIACIALEMKTRRTYKDRGPADDDDGFVFFDEDSDN